MPARLLALARPRSTRRRARRPRPPRPSHHLGAVAAVAVLAAWLASGAGGEPDPAPAGAAVTHASGFAATVAGWTSWYGAYGLADLGWAWCIDHGSSAPDPDLVYAPTSIDAEAGPDTRAALAWAVTMNPPLDDITAAATMLVLHDLRGATYPTGPLDVFHLGPGDLAGFGGAEPAVIDRARAIKGDALAHAHLRAPFTVSLVADRAAPDADGAIRATVTDAAGTPVAGVAVTLEVGGGALTTGPVAYTGADGAAWSGFRAAAGENRFTAHVDLPRTEPALFAPTVAPAQRVVVPAWAPADGTDAYALPPPTTVPPSTTTTVAPTTTSTTRPTTTTTSTTTTTTRPTTTTTRPPPPTPTTTAASTTTSTSTTSTTSTSTTTSTAAVPPTTGVDLAPPPPPSPPAPRPAAATLPRTGRSVTSWVLIGTGLVLCGTTLVAAARRRRLIS